MGDQGPTGNEKVRTSKRESGPGEKGLGSGGEKASGADPSRDPKLTQGKGKKEPSKDENQTDPRKAPGLGTRSKGGKREKETEAPRIRGPETGNPGGPSRERREGESGGSPGGAWRRAKEGEESLPKTDPDLEERKEEETGKGVRETEEGGSESVSKGRVSGGL